MAPGLHGRRIGVVLAFCSQSLSDLKNAIRGCAVLLAPVLRGQGRTLVTLSYNVLGIPKI